MIDAVTTGGGELFGALVAVANPAAVRRGDQAAGAQRSEQASEVEPAQRLGGKSELTDEEKREVDELKKRDAEVRRHEQAHKAAAGQYARGGPTFEYETGPDGKQYAVGGEVSIDTSAVPNDPEATVRKMQTVRRAASAPAEPSAKDRQVASKAAQTEAKARAELARQRVSGDSEGDSSEPDKPGLPRETTEPDPRTAPGHPDLRGMPGLAGDDAPTRMAPQDADPALGSAMTKAKPADGPLDPASASDGFKPPTIGTKSPGLLDSVAPSHTGSAMAQAFTGLTKLDSPGRYIDVRV